jgi:hypothetical protein
MQATITNSGWIVSRNKFGQYSYSKVDAKRMGSVSQTRDFGFVLAITCLVTGKVRKVWNLATLEDAKNIYQNS